MVTMVTLYFFCVEPTKKTAFHGYHGYLVFCLCVLNLQRRLLFMVTMVTLYFVCVC